MKRIRVLRLLEYTYESAEQMQRDMERWGVQSVKRSGARGTSAGEIVIRSVTLPLETLDDPETDK